MHQYDGVAYIYGEKRWYERVYDYFRGGETAENRTTALLAYLPKWKGFLVNGGGDEMKATEAVVELNKVVNRLNIVWVKESDFPPEKKRPSDFNIHTVKCLRIKFVYLSLLETTRAVISEFFLIPSRICAFEAITGTEICINKNCWTVL